MEDLTLPDILAILKRRRRVFALSTALIFLCALLMALHWSNYRSTSMVEIEQPNISRDIASAGGGDDIYALADQRLSQIQQKVTAPGSLAEIIAKFNLYPGARRTTPIEVLADQMRNKIKLNFINSTVANPAAIQKESAEQLSAIAFTLSFDYYNPQIAQQVTNELVSRFLDEDLKLRRTQTQETSDFLAAEIKELETTMADQEKKIAAFRNEHGESGPAILMFNEQAVSSTTMSIQNLDSQITSNEGTQGALRAQLATVDPYSRVVADGQVITTPAIQLKALQAKYATLSAQYGPDHPDVVKARNQIEALKAQIGGNSQQTGITGQLRAQIIDVKTNLAAAEKTEGADNPDVTSLKSQLRKLESRLASEPKTSSAHSNLKADADNPAYLQLASQLSSAEEQHKSLIAERASLQKQRAKYQEDLSRIPALEQEMASLNRDYENSQLRYRELKEKKMAADMSEKLEEGRKGQRLIVINPPTIPKTTYPARLLLILGGIVLALIGGIAAVVVAESMSRNIHSHTHLASVAGATPLVTIPYIFTDEEMRRSARMKPYRVGAAIALAVIAVIAAWAIPA